jgi:predicted ATP-binding protein involved in virulence
LQGDAGDDGAAQAVKLVQHRAELGDAVRAVLEAVEGIARDAGGGPVGRQGVLKLVEHGAAAPPGARQAVMQLGGHVEEEVLDRRDVDHERAAVRGVARAGVLSRQRHLRATVRSDFETVRSQRATVRPRSLAWGTGSLLGPERTACLRPVAFEDLMKLQSLTVQDFRGFERAEVPFEPDVTVLVGVNGAGKTALLDATALLLSYLVAGIRTGRAAGKRLSMEDIRVGASSASVMLRAAFEAPVDAETTWEVATTRPGHPKSRESSLAGLSAPIEAAQASIERGDPVLPLSVYFPTNRNALDIPDRIRKHHEFDPINAFDGALAAGERNFRAFFEWFRDEEDHENQITLQLLSQGKPRASKPSLDAVRRAIVTLVPGASNLRIERQPQRMLLTKHGVPLDVAQLSDGEKCLLAMAGDLARRMAMAAPTAPDPLQRPAVVLIDEIDLHLHPGLQRTILPRLRQVFPRAQFIVSTHSPQVLSSVRASQVRLLEHFQVQRLTRETFRRDTNRILDSVFDDPGRPPEVAEKLNELRDAIDDERYEDARALIADLRALLPGGDDPDVVFYEGLLPPRDVTDAEASG